uniref:Uncharacterized protein n=1 Tax=Panagrolaimus sp. JU765 TaxID=591449 RepID=A0AC34Q0N6_9BILA
MIECGLNEDMEKKADEAYKKFEEIKNQTDEWQKELETKWPVNISIRTVEMINMLAAIRINTENVFHALINYETVPFQYFYKDEIYAAKVPK